LLNIFFEQQQFINHTENMNNKLLTFLFASSLITFGLSSSYAINSESSFETEIVSGFDESEIYNAFSEISDVESYLSVNETATYADIQIMDSTLLEQLNDDTDVAFSHSEKFSFNKQTAFLMGCAFGVVGIIAVAVINNGDNEQLNSSIWGCVTSSCVSIGSVALIYVLYFAILSGGYYYY
jgi:hypothetical protein